MQMLVDDGIKSRGNRKAVFNPKYKYVGAYTGANSKQKSNTCVIFASDVQESAPAAKVEETKAAAAPAEEELSDMQKLFLKKGDPKHTNKPSSFILVKKGDARTIKFKEIGADGKIKMNLTSHQEMAF
jgi:hypothetical protein